MINLWCGVVVPIHADDLFNVILGGEYRAHLIPFEATVRMDEKNLTLDRISSLTPRPAGGVAPELV